MNERLIAKSFGPVKDIDITFKKVTIFIGDQGTGKSCVAKLFSTFVWLEKDLVMGRHNTNYYTGKNAFVTKLCSYHRIESFINNDTYIRFESTSYIFEFKDGGFSITKTEKDINALPKIMYVPAERLVLSVAENRYSLIKELPESCSTFNDEFGGAKVSLKTGYTLPFDNLHYKYDQLNDTSKIWGDDYAGKPVLLKNASSGIQSALPLCLVSEYLSRKVRDGEDAKLSDKERQRIFKEVEEIMSNTMYSKSVKESMLKQLSVQSRYGSFINIAEEPELNLFPLSQMNVLFSLVKNNAYSPDNMLVLTTHSPYTLAIFNLMIMAAKVADRGGERIMTNVAEIVQPECHINPEDISAFCLKKDDTEYCESIIAATTGLISNNALDMVSDKIMQKFNTLCRLYATIAKQ